MGVKVREKVKGSRVYWVFINHNGRRTSRKVGSAKAAQEVARKIEAKLAVRQRIAMEIVVRVNFCCSFFPYRLFSRWITNRSISRRVISSSCLLPRTGRT